MSDGLVLHLESIAGFMEQIGEGAAAQRVLAMQREHTMQLIRSVGKFSVADGAKVCAALNKVPWRPVEREELVSMVADCMTEAPPSGTRSILQDYSSIAVYYTANHWDLLRAEQVSSAAKLEAVLSHAVVLGLRNPSENTLQALAALYIACAEGLGKGICLAPSMKYAILQQTKKSLRAFLKKSTDTTAEFVHVLPPSPPELKRLHPRTYAAAFPSSKPAPVPLDTTQFEALTSSIPMRSSSRLLAVGGSGILQAASHRGPQAGTDMVQCMMQMLQSFVQRRAEPTEVPLTWTPPKPATLIPALPPVVPSPTRPAQVEAATDDDAGADDADGGDAIVAVPVPPARKKSRPSVAETTASIAQALMDRNCKNGAGAENRRDAAEHGPGCTPKSRGKGKNKSKAKSTGKSKDKSQGKTKAKSAGMSKPTMGIEWSREQANTAFSLLGPAFPTQTKQDEGSESSLRIF